MTKDELEVILKNPPRWLWDIVDKILGGRGSSEDVLHDAAQVVRRNSYKLSEWSVQQVHGYLKRVAKRKAYKFLGQDYVRLRTWQPESWDREKKNGHDSWLSSIPGTFINPSEALFLAIDIRKAMEKLDEAERMIADAFMKGMTLTEAAKSLRDTRAKIYHSWQRDVAPKLQKDLAEYGDDMRYLLRRGGEYQARWGGR